MVQPLFFVAYSSSRVPKNSGRWKFGVGWCIGFQDRKWGLERLSPHLYTLAFAFIPSQLWNLCINRAEAGIAIISHHGWASWRSSNTLQ